MMRKALYKGILAFLALLAIESVAAQTEGKSILRGVLVAPDRAVFEGRTRTTELYLVNNSNKTHTYVISLANFRFTETGSFVRVPDNESVDHRADTYIRYSPRRVILEPNKQQVVRLQFNKPANLPDGEYRSYIVFQILPDTPPSDAGDSSAQNEDPQAIRINLVPVFGLLVPLIVRVGSLSASVNLSNLALVSDPESGAKSLSLIVERSGNRSVNGDVSVDYEMEGKVVTPVGKKRILMYVAQDRLTVSIPLSFPDGTSLDKGFLSVRFVESTGQEDKDEPIVATARLALP